MMESWRTMVTALLFTLAAAEDVNCCVKPYSYFDCTGSGHGASPGKTYTCLETSDLRGCMSCLRDEEYSEDSCSTCCSVEEDADCSNVESEWEFYASTLFFICLCCCFTALCGFTEVRRKRKGISFAQAWSVPQAMPILPTWPRRSVSTSDLTGGGGGGVSEGQQWAELNADNEDDAKEYPVAGLVDDTGVAFGFVATMPQALLRSVATALGQSGPRPSPSPQEPELTVWISRDNVGALGTVETSRPQEFDGRSGGIVSGGSGASRAGVTQHQQQHQQRAVVVGNDLEEPLMIHGPWPGIATRSRPRSPSNAVRPDR